MIIIITIVTLMIMVITRCYFLIEHIVHMFYVLNPTHSTHLNTYRVCVSRNKQVYLIVVMTIVLVSAIKVQCSLSNFLMHVIYNVFVVFYTSFDMLRTLKSLA